MAKYLLLKTKEKVHYTAAWKNISIGEEKLTNLWLPSKNNGYKWKMELLSTSKTENTSKLKTYTLKLLQKTKP
jgi:hypothetical protein